MLGHINRLADRIARIGRIGANIQLFLLLVLVNAEIISRYVLGRSTMIADEYGAYFFVGLSFLSFSCAMRNDQFLRVAAISGRLGVRTQRVLHGVAAALATLTCALFTYQSAVLAWTTLTFKTRSMQPSGTLLFIPQTVMPLGLALLTFIFLVDFLNVVATRDRAAGTPDPGA